MSDLHLSRRRQDQQDRPEMTAALHKASAALHRGWDQYSAKNLQHLGHQTKFVVRVKHHQTSGWMLCHTRNKAKTGRRMSLPDCLPIVMKGKILLRPTTPDEQTPPCGMPSGTARCMTLLKETLQQVVVA